MFYALSGPLPHKTFGFVAEGWQARQPQHTVKASKHDEVVVARIYKVNFGVITAPAPAGGRAETGEGQQPFKAVRR